MESFKFHQILTLVSLTLLFPGIHCWGTNGHLAVCRIAQSRLSEAAADAVKSLLRESAENDLGNVCSWADQVKFRYHWSSALQYIDTSDNLYSYQYNRDCKDEDGVRGRCVAGAINNYTTQLLSYKSASSQAEYNLTKALLFLSHFMGDVHQPLHVGFTSDRGGNTIDVHWYSRKQVLHHVWDTNIIETAEQRIYNSNVDDLIDAIQQNITTEWADLVKRWETCSANKTMCPDVYASEGIKSACDWAYKGVTEGSTLEGPISNLSAPNLITTRKKIKEDSCISAGKSKESADPKEVICAAVEKLNVELILVDSHCRGTIQRVDYQFPSTWNYHIRYDSLK